MCIPDAPENVHNKDKLCGIKKRYIFFNNLVQFTVILFTSFYLTTIVCFVQILNLNEN